MPFRTHAKIVLYNGSDVANDLYYDIDATMEEVGEDAMTFCAHFQDIEENELAKDIDILPFMAGRGRFLGTSVAVIPNCDYYGDIWWGESEIKVYLDGDTDFPTLVGTGTEDYIGTAWGQGAFNNMTQGCPYVREDSAACFYRFHTVDPIFFGKEIRVTMQTMGGGDAKDVKELLEKNIPCVPVAYLDRTWPLKLHPIYEGEQKFRDEELSGHVNFYRQDHYRVVAYYYMHKE